jgi:hypothetical protein
MRFNRGQAALALLGVTVLVAGCGGSSSSSSVAHIRTLNASTNGDFLTVLVNGAATFGQQTDNGAAPSYLYINSGVSTFSYATYVDSGGSTSNLPTNVNAYNTKVNLSSGANYTAYVVGRPDLVSLITSTPFPYGSMQTVVYPDTHNTPSSGSVNVRFLNAAPDANGTGNLDFAIDGTKLTAATNVPFGQISQFTVSTSGSHAIEAYEAGTNTLVYSTPANVTFANQHSETIIFQEPTAAPIPNPTTFTYHFQQIED